MRSVAPEAVEPATAAEPVEPPYGTDAVDGTDTTGWSWANAGADTAKEAAATPSAAQVKSGAISVAESEARGKREIGNVVDGQRNMPEILSPRG